MTSRRKKAATVEGIGRELGISAMTVSRALNGHPAVNEETRRKVLQHAERLNYRPNRWARSLVTQKSHIIGIVVPDISHSFFSEITRAVQETIEPHGYDLMLCHTHADVEREKSAIDMLLGSRVDGLIIASSRREDDPGILLELQRQGTPFVLLDRSFTDLSCARVTTDDVLVGRLATQYLIDLGHRRVAHIRGPAVSVGRLRLEGYRAAMQENGLALCEEWVVDGDFELSGGYTAMCALLACKNRPSAVFASNDPSAIGAIQACREAGLDVPREVSIIGAGSIESPYSPNPFLTTVDWSRKELGQKGAELLLEAIAEGSGCGREEWISAPQLLVRQSTARPADTYLGHWSATADPSLCAKG